MQKSFRFLIAFTIILGMHLPALSSDSGQEAKDESKQSEAASSIPQEYTEKRLAEILPLKLEELKTQAIELLKQREEKTNLENTNFKERLRTLADDDEIAKIERDKCEDVYKQKLAKFEMLTQTDDYKASSWPEFTWPEYKAAAAAKLVLDAEEAKYEKTLQSNTELRVKVEKQKETNIAAIKAEGDAAILADILKADQELTTLIDQGYLKALDIFRQNPDARVQSQKDDTNPLPELIISQLFDSASALIELGICFKTEAFFKAKVTEILGGEDDVLNEAFVRSPLEASQLLVEKAAIKQNRALSKKAAAPAPANNSSRGFLSRLWGTAEPAVEAVDPEKIAAEAKAKELAINAFLNGYTKFIGAK